MSRIRRVCLLTICGTTMGSLGLAFTAPLPVLAGTGPSQVCEDGAGNDDIPLLTTPVTLGLEVGSPALAPAGLGGRGGNYVTLCYSPTPYGSTAQVLTGGAISVHLVESGSTVSTDETACYPDGFESLIVNCDGSETASYTVTPASPPGEGAMITASVPFTICAGTSVTGTPACGAGAPALGSTGLIVTSLALGGAPLAGETGGTVASTGALYVDGVLQVPFGTSAGAGVSNPPSIGGGLGGPGLPVCVLSSCVSIPGAWVGSNGAPLGSVDIAGTVLPIASPLPGPACEVAIGTTCLTGY